jgi:hypothetical protein
MIHVVRFAVAAAIVFAAAPAMSQEALRRGPGAAPATEAGAPADKAAESDRKDLGKTDAEGESDVPRSGPTGCPYIKRKLELIV